MDFRTIRTNGTSEIIEKKSRFLGEAVRVGTPDEAEAYLASVRKRYYDARHHCFAYVAGEPGSPAEVTRTSDDGEPSGTAGRPMLEVLTGRGLHGCLLVVTRYFGGTLLGTGGLVRAYTAAARDAVGAAGIVTVRQGVRLRIRCPYTQLGRLSYRLAKEGIPVTGTEYGEGVTVEVLPAAGRKDFVLALVTELTDGAGQVEVLGPAVFEEPCGEEG